MKKKTQKKGVFDYILLVFFTAMIVITIYPFLNVLAVSLNDPTDTMRNVNFVIPRVFTLYNYKYIFEEENLIGPLLMSVSQNTGRHCFKPDLYGHACLCAQQKRFYFPESLYHLFCDHNVCQRRSYSYIPVNQQKFAYDKQLLGIYHPRTYFRI